jgi:hypothetical protein
MTQPKVSVLMSVYNGERYLREAVESILNQTSTDFEFIIVDDGSTDSTQSILESYDDPRLLLARNQENIGLTRSLNKGLALAQGEYVARMDADDIAMPYRFEKQIAFLEKHSETGILGSNGRLIDANGRERGLYQLPPSDLQIRWRFLLANPFLHPTVMIRRNVLAQNGLIYDEAFQATQDYELWTRILKYTRGANLSELLIQYRLHHGVTSTHRETQLKNHDRVALRTIQEQLPDFSISPEQITQLRSLLVGRTKHTPSVDAHRVVLAELYLDMFEAFLSRHSGEPDLKALQRQEALRVARLILRPPLQPGWMRVIRCLLTLDPGLPWSFLRYLPSAVGQRLYEIYSHLNL